VHIVHNRKWLNNVKKMDGCCQRIITATCTKGGGGHNVLTQMEVAECVNTNGSGHILLTTKVLATKFWPHTADKEKWPHNVGGDCMLYRCILFTI
jgi:hypothetical protein